MIEAQKKRKGGFACMGKERLREVTSRGGLTAWARGHAHRWTSEEAREAGKKGGSTPKKRRRQDEQPVV
jgi:general stress protein YciG